MSGMNVDTKPGNDLNISSFQRKSMMALNKYRKEIEVVRGYIRKANDLENDAVR